MPRNWELYANALFALVDVTRIELTRAALRRGGPRYGPRHHAREQNATSRPRYASAPSSATTSVAPTSVVACPSVRAERSGPSLPEFSPGLRAARGRNLRHALGERRVGWHASADCSIEPAPCRRSRSFAPRFNACTPTCRESSRAIAAPSSSTPTRTLTRLRRASSRLSLERRPTRSGSTRIRSPKELRSKAASVYGLTPEQVLAGNGSDELLTMILRACVGPGDRVVFPVPTAQPVRDAGGDSGRRQRVPALPARLQAPAR